MIRTSNNHDNKNIIVAMDIVVSYVLNNCVPAAALSPLLASTHRAVVALSAGASSDVPPRPVELSEMPKPAQIRRSITPDAIISFIDGNGYKTMKRHLRAHGLDPRSYRQRFGLPADYPMVAPSYALQRSELAKLIGLGRVGGRERETVAE